MEDHTVFLVEQQEQESKEDHTYFPDRTNRTRIIKKTTLVFLIEPPEQEKSRRPHLFS
jgi:hypothetical protein